MVYKTTSIASYPFAPRLRRAMIGLAAILL
jgi:hypothetical protein